MEEEKGGGRHLVKEILKMDDPLKALPRSASWENQIFHSPHMPLEGKEAPGRASHGMAVMRLLKFRRVS